MASPPPLLQEHAYVTEQHVQACAAMEGKASKGDPRSWLRIFTRPTLDSQKVASRNRNLRQIWQWAAWAQQSTIILRLSR